MGHPWVTTDVMVSAHESPEGHGSPMGHLCVTYDPKARALGSPISHVLATHAASVAADGSSYEGYGE